MQSTRLKHDTTSMGGMFTVFKVRDRGYADPGWYDAPAGTTASAATAEQTWPIAPGRCSSSLGFARIRTMQRAVRTGAGLARFPGADLDDDRLCN